MQAAVCERVEAWAVVVGSLNAHDHHSVGPPDSRCPAHRCRSSRGARDPALMRLMLEAPRLPAAAVPLFLAATTALGPDWATAALSTANNIVLLRPPDRSGPSTWDVPHATAGWPGHRTWHKALCTLPMHSAAA
jgi:hypothetical protein